jgi:hypothetical protein
MSPCRLSVITTAIARDRVEASQDFVTLGADEILNPLRPLSGAGGQTIKLLGREQHEFALTALGNIDRTAKRCFNDLTGTVSKIG